MTTTELQAAVAQAASMLRSSGLAAADTHQLNGMQAAQTGESVSYGQLDHKPIVSKQSDVTYNLSAGQMVMNTIALLDELASIEIEDDEEEEEED